MNEINSLKHAEGELCADGAAMKRQGLLIWSPLASNP